MLIMKLDDLHQPITTIELKDTDSLVWTERHQEPGDFQLVFLDDISAMNTFLIDDLISHTDTTEVMIVENHEVTRDKDKKLKTTISGRSFETFAENRVTTGSGDQLTDISTGDALVQIMTNVEAANVAAVLLMEAFEPGTATSDNAIANLIVNTNMRVLDDPMDHPIKRGDVYSVLVENLKMADAGIKTVRPTGITTTLNVVVHDGLDLTDSVAFYAQQEDLDDATYFWSSRNYKNYAAIATLIYSELYRHRNIGVNQTGLDRRVMYVEARDLEDNYTQSPSNVVSSRAQGALDEHHQVSLLTATISITARPKFKIDYDVGDIVMVYGEFGAVQAMQITEHILTVDKDGMRGFPSLTIV